MYVNRATAYKKLKKFDLMYDDSQSAIEYDDTYFKSYIKNGEACLELSKSTNHRDTVLIDKGLKRLQKAIMILEKLKPVDPNHGSKK